MLYFPSDHPYFDDAQPVQFDGTRPMMWHEVDTTRCCSAPSRLDEITAPDILHIIDPRDLPHRDYAPLIKYVRYKRFATRNMMEFFVPSPVEINEWYSYVQWTQWDDVVRDTSLTAPEAARLLYWSGDMRVWCGCPSFLFWGYQYILTQLDASIEPENRFPKIRNPNLKGVCCKHLRKVMKILGFHVGDMAKEIKRQRSQAG